MKIDVANLAFIDPRLREILVFVERQSGLEFTITSLYRINDGGVHGQLPLRGTDLRCRVALVGHEIASLVNRAYQYDPERPHKQCAIFHDSGQGPHLHLQVHPNTRQI